VNWLKLSRLKLEARFCELDDKTFRLLHEPLFSFRRSRSADLHLGKTGVVFIVNSLGMGVRGIVVLLPTWARNVSLYRNVKTGFGTYIPSYSESIGISFPGLKRPRLEAATHPM